MHFPTSTTIFNNVLWKRVTIKSSDGLAIKNTITNIQHLCDHWEEK